MRFEWDPFEEGLNHLMLVEEYRNFAPNGAGVPASVRPRNAKAARREIAAEDAIQKMVGKYKSLYTWPFKHRYEFCWMDEPAEYTKDFYTFLICRYDLDQIRSLFWHMGRMLGHGGKSNITGEEYDTGYVTRNMQRVIDLYKGECGLEFPTIDQARRELERINNPYTGPRISLYRTSKRITPEEIEALRLREEARRIGSGGV